MLLVYRPSNGRRTLSEVVHVGVDGPNAPAVAEEFVDQVGPITTPSRPQPILIDLQVTGPADVCPSLTLAHDASLSEDMDEALDIIFRTSQELVPNVISRNTSHHSDDVLRASEDSIPGMISRIHLLTLPEVHESPSACRVLDLGRQVIIFHLGCSVTVLVSAGIGSPAILTTASDGEKMLQ